MREFMVELTTAVPEGTDPAEVDRRRAAEAVRAGELAEQGRLFRLRRPVGEVRSVGIWRADDESDLRSNVRTPSGSVASNAAVPSGWICAAARSSRCSSRPVMNTWPPSARTRRAVSKPMPELPPITTTTCPASPPSFCSWLIADLRSGSRNRAREYRDE